MNKGVVLCVLWLGVEILFDILAVATYDSSARKPSFDDADASPAPRAVDWVVAVLFGVVVGATTVLVVSDRILPPAPINGTSLVVAPLLAGACMHYLGRRLRANGYAIDFLSTFHGAAWFAFWIAAARFVLMQPGFVAQ